MKKFSTVGAALAFTLLSASLQANAQANELSADAPAVQSAGEATATSAAPKCEFRANAPDKHVVVRGDTLWGISGRFLQNPWCWPQVWDMNREDIKNPHWIYPNQVIYFDRAAGRLRLGTAPDGMQTVKLSPGMRSTRLEDLAIPSIPTQAIEPFLSQPLIIGANDLANTPRIVAGSDERVFFGKDDKVYVRGALNGETRFHAFRPGKPLKDPLTGKVIAYEAAFLGTLTVEQASSSPSTAHRMIVDDAQQEMGAGDHLVPVPPTPVMNYVPHAPARRVDANVMAVYGAGLSMAASHQIVSVNRGESHGLDVGSVLALHRSGRVVVDKSVRQRVKLPDEEYGNLFIFRVFPHVAYGLVMHVDSPVRIGDRASSPQ